VVKADARAEMLSKHVGGLEVSDLTSGQIKYLYIAIR